MEADKLARFLKAYTRQAHHRVDQHPLLKPLMQAKLEVNHYGYALTALYPAVCWLEQSVMNAATAYRWAYPVVSRSALLAADLAALGWVAPTGITTKASLPASKAHALGALYVLEGSRLGGEMIARHVQKRLGETVPRRFFTAPHPLGPGFWPLFWRFAVAECAPREWQAVGDGAWQAFASFETKLSLAQPLLTPSPAPKE
ncbi:biliverdin-producing heme oxygenase [Vreelandella massiliensis]|uniref:biliverdin-producing heme oxygenase n=1 Tax=Vreelandella massiliensis TaxID=1816686 RepID=UPI00096ABAFF|nr:biliverdin-producing heme oxygenase [Halomonas massiliensis]